ncbi:hypothetical protein AB205_0185630, partial [Aquarana catesbeiana]
MQGFDFTWKCSTNPLWMSFGIAAFFITSLTYVYILNIIMKIKIKDGRWKVFSTGSYHLTVVLMFYATTFFNYIIPKTYAPYTRSDFPTEN